MDTNSLIHAMAVPLPDGRVYESVLYVSREFFDADPKLASDWILRQHCDQMVRTLGEKRDTAG